MNKKGYTLIELLSSITLMTLIATIASINVIKIFDTKEKESAQSKNSIIETAACVYIELEKNKSLKDNCLLHGCDINTDTLINEGLLKEEDVDNYKVIHIFKNNNEKTCKVK